jgi:capsular polysaccharide transport system permease protein
MARSGVRDDVRAPGETGKALVRGAFVQFQVIRALVLRETRTRFGEHQLGYLWAVLEPLIWVGTFWGMYEIAHRKVSHGLDTISFLATGIITYELFSRNVARIGDAINGNKPLLFYPQVQPIDLVWARACLETATLTSVFAIVMGGVALLRGQMPDVDDVLRTLLGLSLAALLGTSVGLFLGMLGMLSGVMERLRGPLMRPLFWVSGLFYTLDDVPSQAQHLLGYNPVLHTIELVRDGWFVGYESPQAEPTYVVAYILAFGALGLLLERVVRRKIELS